MKIIKRICNKQKKEKKEKLKIYVVILPGVPAGLLFLLLVTPFSREANASEEEDGAAEEAVLSNMDGFCCFLVTIWWGWLQIQSLPVQLVRLE